MVSMRVRNAKRLSPPTKEKVQNIVFKSVVINCESAVRKARDCQNQSESLDAEVWTTNSFSSTLKQCCHFDICRTPSKIHATEITPKTSEPTIKLIGLIHAQKGVSALEADIRGSGTYSHNKMESNPSTVTFEDNVQNTNFLSRKSGIADSMQSTNVAREPSTAGTFSVANSSNSSAEKRIRIGQLSYEFDIGAKTSDASEYSTGALHYTPNMLGSYTLHPLHNFDGFHSRTSSIGQQPTRSTQSVRKQHLEEAFREGQRNLVQPLRRSPLTTENKSPKRSVVFDEALLRREVSMYSPASVITPTPKPIIIKHKSTVIREMRKSSPKRFEQVVDRLRALSHSFCTSAENMKCSEPHQLLCELQNLALRTLEDFGLEVHFLLTGRVDGEQPKVYPRIMSKNDFQGLKGTLAPINNVYTERDVSWFHRFQPSFCNDDDGPLQQIENFIKRIKVGPTGGRFTVGDPFKRPRNLPLCLYSSELINSSETKSPITSSDDWNVYCDCVLPIYIYTVCTGSLNTDTSDIVNGICDILDEISSDWRSHLTRLNYTYTERYQQFIPTIGRMPTDPLKRAGWNEMVFNESCVIRWKTIQGGLMLSYMDGHADSPVDKTMCLAFDADHHVDWIPFLSHTKRLFALQPLALAFQYQVALPWPMSNRELSVFGMATNSLDVPNIKAIQMWCCNAPKVAKTIMGVPLPSVKPKSVDMEIPTLAFMLSPITETRTRVQLCAVFDVKVAFIPLSVQNHLAKLMATKMLSNVQKIAQNFDKTVYKNVFDKNQEFFKSLLV